MEGDLLFPGETSTSSQSHRFSRELACALQTEEGKQELRANGLAEGEIGVHSIRKGEG